MYIFTYIGVDASWERKTGGGDIQTTPLYAFQPRASHYNWRWDLHAFIYVAWQLLLWSPGPESNTSNSLCNALVEASEPYSSTAYFKNSPFMDLNQLKQKMEGLKKNKPMKEFMLKDMKFAASSVRGCVTDSKSRILDQHAPALLIL